MRVDTKKPIVVFTPTLQPGGVDVNLASIRRQTVFGQIPIVWAIADERLEQRHNMWYGLDKELTPDIQVSPFKLRVDTPRSLAASYNAGLAIAREIDAQLFVSLQDYFWVPEDGIERFLRMTLANENLLVSGLASITDNPPAEMVADLDGDFTIFEEPYEDEPEHSFWWSEVRGEGMTEPYQATPIEWELNWAAISRDVLRTGVDFDPAFDYGIGWENQDFAFRCWEGHGARVIVDPLNHALGLPHKLYFPEQTQINADVNDVNRQLMQKLGRL